MITNTPTGPSSDLPWTPPLTRTLPFKPQSKSTKLLPLYTVRSTDSYLRHPCIRCQTQPAHAPTQLALSVEAQELLSAPISTVPPGFFLPPIPTVRPNFFDLPHTSPKLQMLLLFGLITYTNPQFWKVARYFTKSPTTVPPLLHQGVQVYHSPHKAKS